MLERGAEMKKGLADAVERLSEVVKSRPEVVETRASARKRIRSEIMTRGDQLKRQAKRQHKVYIAHKCYL